MRLTKLILAFCVWSLIFGMVWTSIVCPPVTKLKTVSPTPQGLPDEFTPLPNRGVVNNELDHYQAFNPLVDDFMQIDETPGINFSVSEVDDVTYIANGTNSCRLFYQNYGKARFPAFFTQIYSDPYPNIRYNATFAFNWFLESIDNMMAEQDFVRVSVYLNISNRYICYYLGGYMPQETNSYSLNVTGHNTTSAMMYTWRNLTQDYIDRWVTISQDIGILFIQVQVDQARYRPVPSITYLDNMSVIINDANTVLNGDFEAVDSLQRPSNWLCMDYNQEYAPASIKHVNAGMSDSHAVNISARVTTITTGRNFLSYSNLAATWLNENRTANNCSVKRPMSLALNYKIENFPQTEDAWAQLSLTFYNDTGYQNINFYFYDTQLSSRQNDSTHLFIMLDNRTNMWLTAKVDLWPLLSSINSGPSSQLISLAYEVLCYGDEGDGFSIIFDSMGLQTTTFTDAQFENPPAIQGKIGGWTNFSLQMNYTTTAYSGLYAANFTKYGSYSSGYAVNYYQTFGITKGLIIEADYFIPSLPGNPTDSISLMLYLQPYDGTVMKSIAYTLAISDSSQVTGNGSISGRFFEKNITGQWCHLQRNLYNDFILLFAGAIPENYYLNYLLIFISSFQIEKPLTVILDNTNLKIANDPNPPRITGISLDPSPPKAGTSLKVTAQVVDDGIGVQTVTLIYSTDTGTSWQSKVMSAVGTNNYCATIENLAENTILSYYIVAADAFGNTAQSTTSGSSTQVVVLPSFSFWEAFLFGALIAGGAIGASLVTVKVRQVKKAKAGRVVPAAGLSSATKQP